jgi:hypothetical protein
MNRESMLKPALIGGVALGVLSAIPIIGMFNCACCAWVLIGGLLAAYLYVKESSIPVSLGRGAGLGLITGVIGSMICTLFTIPILLLSAGPGGFNFASMLQQQMEKMPNVPLETRQAMDKLAAGGGLVFLFVILGVLFSLFIFAIFGMIGSTVGVALFEKRTIGTPPPNPPSYTPPVDMLPPPME